MLQNLNGLGLTGRFIAIIGILVLICKLHKSQLIYQIQMLRLYDWMHDFAG